MSRSLLSRLPWIGRLLQALGVNSVPAAGYFGGGWSIGTTLAVYWLETVMVIVLVSVRVVLHRRWTRKAGHWSVPIETRTTRSGRLTVRRGHTTFLSGFLTIMGVFTAAHGVFLGMLVFFILPREAPAQRVSGADLRAGLEAMAIFLGLGFAFDLVGLRTRPFRWIQRLTDVAQGRMFVTHLTIVLGMGAMAFWNTTGALFGVFVTFKTLMDLGTLFPDRDLEPEPPRWIAWLDRFGRGKDGLTFTESYRTSVGHDVRQRELNERVVGEAG